MRRTNPSSIEFYRVCVCVSVIQCNNNPLHLQRMGRRGPNKKHFHVHHQENNVKYICKYAVIYLFLHCIVYFKFFQYFVSETYKEQTAATSGRRWNEPTTE
jgi:hypothetical protein